MIKRFFFDTSALIKLYHEETGTNKLDSLIESENPVIVISDLTIIEMISALAKKVRMKVIVKDTFIEVVSDFENDLAFYDVIETDKTIKTKAVSLIKSIGGEISLKTLDALQLASALVVSEFFN